MYGEYSKPNGRNADQIRLSKCDQKIQEDDLPQNIPDKNGWNDIGDYEIGQTVPYKYESNIPNMNGYKTYYYAWHDKMDKALTFQPESVKITIPMKRGKATR